MANQDSAEVAKTILAETLSSLSRSMGYFNGGLGFVMAVWVMCGSDGGFGCRGSCGGFGGVKQVKVIGCVGRVATGCGGYGLCGLCGGGYGPCLWCGLISTGMILVGSDVVSGCSGVGLVVQWWGLGV